MSREEIVNTVREHLDSELSLNGQVVGESDELATLPNADSVRLVRVAARLERRFGVEFEDEGLFGAKTLADLVDLVAAGLSARQV
jgi:acyl carrier protein